MSNIDKEAKNNFTIERIIYLGIGFLPIRSISRIELGF